MPTEVLKVDPTGDNRDILRRAVEVLRAGRLVAFPTETVYGVGARADRVSAVELLRQVKVRDIDKPFTVHIGDPADVHQFVPGIRGMARRFVRRAWPGPVTIVFPVDEPRDAPVIRDVGSDHIPLMYYQNTVGIRCPDDAIASKLLSDLDAPVVAASANRAGSPPPRSAEGVMAELNGAVDVLLDGGIARYAKSSTVVRLRPDGFDVLREGVIDERTLRRFAALNVLFVCSGNTCRSPMAAALCRDALARRLGCSVSDLAERGITVSSAGVSSSGGAPATEAAMVAMSRRGIDISDHVAQSIDAGIIQRADHIYCMTRAHLDAVLDLVPSAASRTELLGGHAEIDDPFGGSDEGYEHSVAAIEAALQRRLAELLE